MKNELSVTKEVDRSSSAAPVSARYTEMKNRITIVAQQLFEKVGVKSVTMSDLARELGFAKKTIYTCFENKDEIVAAVVSKKIDDNIDSLVRFKQQAENLITEAFLGWTTVRNFLKQINGQFFLQVKKYYPEIFKTVRNFQYDFLYNHFKTNIEIGINLGLYRHNIKADVVARYIISGILAPSVEDIFWKEELSSDEMEMQILIYHFHAIITEKGYAEMEKYRLDVLQSAKR